MTLPPRSALAPLLTALLLTTWGSPLMAQSPETRRQLHQLVSQANDSWRAQDFERALDLYNRAYALSPHPDLLYRIGQVHERLDHPRAARESYERYLVAVPSNPYAERIQKKIALLKEAEQGAPPTLLVQSEPPGATLLIDGQVMRGVTPTELSPAAGEHLIVVRLEGYKEASRSVHLSAGEHLEQTLTLEPLIAPEVEDPVDLIPEEVEPPPEEEAFEEAKEEPEEEELDPQLTFVDISAPRGLKVLAYGLIVPGTISLALGTTLFAVDGSYSFDISGPMMLGGGLAVGLASYILFIKDWKPRTTSQALGPVSPRRDVQVQVGLGGGRLGLGVALPF